MSPAELDRLARRAGIPIPKPAPQEIPVHVPPRSDAITHLLAVVVGAAEEVGETPVEVMEIELGGRVCLLALGVTPDELAAAERAVAEL